MDNFVNNIFTDVQPVDYEEISRNSSRHLRYSDYKHLKDVKFTEDEKINWFEVLTILFAFASITLILFLSEV